MKKNGRVGSSFEEVTARPIKRVIQREVGDRLATAILDGTIGEGDTVTVDADDDELHITT